MTEPLSILTGIASLGKTVAEIAASNDATQRNALLIEFQKALIQNQTFIATEQLRNAQLSSLNQELEKEIVSLKDWSAEKQNYEVLEIASGIFAYVAKNNVQPLQSAHKFCANCFNKGVKTLLQQQRVEVGRQLSVVCNPCKSTLIFRYYSDQA